MLHREPDCRYPESKQPMKNTYDDQQKRERRRPSSFIYDDQSTWSATSSQAMSVHTRLICWLSQEIEANSIFLHMALWEDKRKGKKKEIMNVNLHFLDHESQSI